MCSINYDPAVIVIVLAENFAIWFSRLRQHPHLGKVHKIAF